MFENTRVETTVAEHVFRTRGKVLLVPGWRGVYGERVDGRALGDDDEGGEQQLPKLEKGETAEVREIAVAREGDQAAAALHRRLAARRAMETAGKLVDDDELREAMKDSGIGTPATRAAIIERLIDVGYIEREGRALVATEKGLNVIRLLGEHQLTSPTLTGEWEHRLAKIEHGGGLARRRSWSDIVKFAEETVARARRRRSRTCASRARTSGRARSAGATSPRTARAVRLLVARGPGLRLRHLEGQGRQAAQPVAIAAELDQARAAPRSR